MDLLVSLVEGSSINFSISSKSGIDARIEVNALNESCNDVITKDIIINPIFSLYIPNSFTPSNFDGLNDIFLVKGLEDGIQDFQMYIYNRWGDQVFYTQSPYEGWNGHVNNGKKIANQAIYVYIVNIVDIYKKSHKVIGHVSLIR